MIVTGFLGAIKGFFSFVLGIVGNIDLPDWSDQLQTALTSLTVQLAGLGAWVNWPLAVTVAAVVLNVFLACLAVKIVLRIIAFVPMVGGAG